jgi:hypothetical protein
VDRHEKSVLDLAAAQASREDARSVTLAGGGILLAQLFSATLLRASAAGAQQSPSAADLLASMRAKFKTPFPSKRKSLLTMSLNSLAYFFRISSVTFPQVGPDTDSSDVGEAA